MYYQRMDSDVFLGLLFAIESLKAMPKAWFTIQSHITEESCLNDASSGDATSQGHVKGERPCGDKFAARNP